MLRPAGFSGSGDLGGEEKHGDDRTPGTLVPMATEPIDQGSQGDLGVKVELGVDEGAWRLWSTVTTICLALTIGAIALGGTLAYGPVTGGLTTALFLLLLSPLLGVARFTARAARSEPWIGVRPSRLTIHHPTFLAEDLEIDLDAVHSFSVCDRLNEPQVGTEASAATLWASAQPSAATPDLFTVTQVHGWNFVLILKESFFLATAPRRALGWVNYLSRGLVCSRAPSRNYWIRGFFGVVPDPEQAKAALTGAGLAHTELTPEVLTWLADEPPVPLGRAWRNYRRDKKRRRPGVQ